MGSPTLVCFQMLGQPRTAGSSGMGRNRHYALPDVVMRQLEPRARAPICPGAPQLSCRSVMRMINRISCMQQVARTVASDRACRILGLASSKIFIDPGHRVARDAVRSTGQRAEGAPPTPSDCCGPPKRSATRPLGFEAPRPLLLLCSAYSAFNRPRNLHGIGIRDRSTHVIKRRLCLELNTSK